MDNCTGKISQHERKTGLVMGLLDLFKRKVFPCVHEYHTVRTEYEVLGVTLGWDAMPTKHYGATKVCKKCGKEKNYKFIYPGALARRYDKPVNENGWPLKPDGTQYEIHN